MSRLMIPGPTEMAPSVREAMGRRAVAHYGLEWIDVYDQTCDLLGRVFGAASPPVLMVGPGTGGLEAGAGTLLRPGERVAVAVNGSFGDRLLGVMESLALDPVPIEVEWGAPVTPDDVAPIFEREADIRLLAVVHSETSTGVLNPVAELAVLAREHGVLTLVDAISSLGGAPLAFDGWGLDLCVGAPQKCLAAAPGLCPVTVSDRAWQEMETRRDRNPRGWTLNLLKWRDVLAESAEWEPYPVTVPCALVLALREALNLLLAEGLEARLRRIASLAAAFRAGIRALGCRTLAEECWCSPTTSAIALPEGVSGLSARRFLDMHRGIQVGFGAGPYRDRGLRVGHFGETATWECTELLLMGLAEYLRAESCRVPDDAGLTVARAALS